MSLKLLHNCSKFLVKNLSSPQLLIPTNQNLGNSLFRFKSDIKVVEYEDVKKYLKDTSTYVIDVRSPDLFKEAGHIPTSLNMPLKLVRKHLGPEMPNECFRAIYMRSRPGTRQAMIFLCKSGAHALKGAEIAAGLGYKNVLHYKGSYDDWVAKEAIPPEKSDKRVCKKPWDDD